MAQLSSHFNAFTIFSKVQISWIFENFFRKSFLVEFGSGEIFHFYKRLKLGKLLVVTCTYRVFMSVFWMTHICESWFFISWVIHQMTHRRNTRRNYQMFHSDRHRLLVHLQCKGPKSTIQSLKWGYIMLLYSPWPLRKYDVILNWLTWIAARIRWWMPGIFCLWKQFSQFVHHTCCHCLLFVTENNVMEILRNCYLKIPQVK